MTTHPVVESLDNTHCAEIINLILPIQQDEFNVPVTVADQPDLRDIEVNYHRTGGGFWGVHIDGQLVGTIALIAIGNQAGVIRKMFVHKEFRGKERKIAQKLLQVLVDYCQQAGISDLYLGTVDRLQAAIRFYERNGFVRTAVEDLPADFPRMAVDNIFFHLQLAK